MFRGPAAIGNLPDIYLEQIGGHHKNLDFNPKFSPKPIPHPLRAHKPWSGHLQLALNLNRRVAVPLFGL